MRTMRGHSGPLLLCSSEVFTWVGKITFPAMSCTNDTVPAILQALTRLGDRRRIEESKLVVQTPMVGPGLFAAAGHLENHPKNLLANLLNGCFPSSDAAGVDIDQVRPPFCKRTAGSHFDHRRHGK